MKRVTFMRMLTVAFNTMMLFFIIYRGLFPVKFEIITSLVCMWDSLVVYSTFMRDVLEDE